MKSRYEAYMDGVALSSIHADIAILDISHEQPSTRRETANHAKGAGLFIGESVREQTRVTITFELHMYRIAARQEVCQQVAAWAQGRILETNDRPGQRLHVVCEEPPMISSAKNWTEPVSVTFTAYEQPFWEENFPAKATLTNASRTGTLFVPGNGGYAKADALITMGETLSTLTITADETSITLSGIAIPAGGIISISHDEHGILKIMYGTLSLLDKRTGSDELLVKSGKINSVSINANATCVISARGIWL